MPSKRTNDSVDRILEALNIQQAQAGLRDSVTDRQVDEILRSVGITTAPAQPVPCLLYTSLTGRAETKVGVSDPVVCEWKCHRSTDKSYPGDNRLIPC